MPLHDDVFYAYENGYERGFSGRSLKPWPSEVPVSGPVATALKAGFADGEHDRKQRAPWRANYDTEQLYKIYGVRRPYEKPK